MWLILTAPPGNLDIPLSETHSAYILGSQGSNFPSMESELHFYCSYLSPEYKDSQAKGRVMERNETGSNVQNLEMTDDLGALRGPLLAECGAGAQAAHTLTLLCHLDAVSGCPHCALPTVPTQPKSQHLGMGAED